MSMRLLVVDDEPAVLEMLKTNLESLGYEVLALTDSREAAWRADHQKFDGVFLDSCMPVLNGPQLVRHIRKSNTNGSVPIVMISGCDDIETMRAGFRAGITFFLAKPRQLAHISAVLNPLQGAMLRERRSYIRLPLRTIVNCRKENAEFAAFSLNVCEAGILLEHSEDLSVGQEIELRLPLPNTSRMINPRAVVVRKGPPGRFAARFVGLSPEDNEAIQCYIIGVVND